MNFLGPIFDILRLLPTLSSAGAVVHAEPPGDTDLMEAKPVAEPHAVSRDISIDRTSMRLTPGQYIRQETAKSLIVLHFTAGGSARGAFNSWVADARTVATAYIVDVDGAIFETFDPKYWAYALGIKGAAGPPNERRAIQIEITGWGPLKKVGDYLCSWPRNWTNRYCRLDESSRYVKASFRGIDYYTAYPDAQLAAVCQLVKHLCETYSIPKDVPPLELRGKCDVARFSKWQGIAAHENYRTDKYDVGPAFPWSRLESAL